MLELKKIAKVYKTKSGKECAALNGIDLSLPKSGMVFLCGKSGSGKSTLLNILGGLDSPSSGEISYNGNSFSGFSDKNFADYRNSVVGFVFQDYNLIDNLSVTQNIEIALSLKNMKNKTELVENALKSVGLSNLQNRRINELSGGQKQRVAIARALVKEPKIILADEPTGNLDSQTAAEIFDLLKELSKNRLVVVVTHDIESAKKYHDYLIELKDGKIVFNNCQTTAAEFKPLQKPKSSLPFFVAVKLGTQNLLLRPFRAISVSLIAVCTIICIIVCQFLLSFGTEKTQARLLDDKNIAIISLEQSVKQGTVEASAPITFATREMLADKYSSLKSLKRSGGAIIVEGSEEILDFGLRFKGDYLELDDSTIYFSDNYLDIAYQNGSYYIESGNDFVRLTQSEFAPSQIIGKRLKQMGGEPFILGGVVDTSAFFSEVELQNNFYKSILTSLYFHTADFAGRTISNNMRITNMFGLNTVSLSNNVNSYSWQDSVNFYTKGRSQDADCIVLHDGTITDLEGLDLSDSQIVISLTLYNKLFNKTLAPYDFVEAEGQYSPTYTLKQIPPKLNSQFDFELSENGVEFKLSGSFTVVGVALDFAAAQTAGNLRYLVLPRQFYQKVYDDFYLQELVVSTEGISNKTAFLRDLGQKNAYAINPYTEILRDSEERVLLLTNIFGLLSIVLGVVVLLVSFNLISVSILHRTKELGILKALGAKNEDLFSIYFTEAAILASITFLISLVASFVAAGYLNRIFTLSYNMPMTLFAVDLPIILTLLISAFLPIICATALPLIKITKLNPMQVLRTSA